MDTQYPERLAQGRIAAIIAHTRARHTRQRTVVEEIIRRQLEE